MEHDEIFIEEYSNYTMREEEFYMFCPDCHKAYLIRNCVTRGGFKYEYSANDDIRYIGNIIPSVQYFCPECRKLFSKINNSSLLHKALKDMRNYGMNLYSVIYNKYICMKGFINSERAKDMELSIEKARNKNSSVTIEFKTEQRANNKLWVTIEFAYVGNIEWSYRDEAFSAIAFQIMYLRDHYFEPNFVNI